jgi:hypothetical protein
MSVQLQPWTQAKRGYFCLPGTLIEGEPTAQMRLIGVLSSRGEPFYTRGFGRPRFGPPVIVTSVISTMTMQPSSMNISKALPRLSSRSFRAIFGEKNRLMTKAAAKLLRSGFQQFSRRRWSATLPSRAPPFGCPPEMNHKLSILGASAVLRLPGTLVSWNLVRRIRAAAELRRFRMKEWLHIDRIGSS